MSIAKIYSADIFVSDLDKAVDFYVNTRGFEKCTDERPTFERARGKS